MNLSVDVISDVICPWCLVSKPRLEKAIAAHGKPVTPTSPKKPDEDAGAEAEITTAQPAEGAASQDEETSPKRRVGRNGA